MSRLRTAVRAAASVSVLTAAVLTAPQAVAAEQPGPAAAAANVCSTGYTLRKAVPLPLGTDPRERLATLFAYENGGKGCVILDNNVGRSRYMLVQVCKVGGTSCDKNSGNFSEYAGPVYVSGFACAPVTAKMGTSSSSLSVNYKSDYVFPCG
ncbi:hypothetical protein [Streptomyces indiaensis]|uniref:Spore-associated protein A n=1 Tax=Streptomyces indiaensis TaxID=284033 RepID=A0ABN3EJR9_9ACTN|nr:hypothetical protein [Streptomyces indiaensis]MCF1645677.1 hypothetical protein [Streptomyces indiaensis]